MSEPFGHLSVREKVKLAEEHKDDELVHCPECDTTVWKDTVEDAVETAEKHEESRHGGEPTVEVNGMLLPSFSEEEKVKIREAVASLNDSTGDSNE